LVRRITKKKKASAQKRRKKKKKTRVVGKTPAMAVLGHESALRSTPLLGTNQYQTVRERPASGKKPKNKKGQEAPRKQKGYTLAPST